MIIGFTGTREGINERQIECLYNAFMALTMTGQEIEFHHGDCIGADKQAHFIAACFGARTIGHPPIDERLRAYTINDQNFAPKPYGDRNKDIVDCSALIIACPLTDEEQMRSGTWQTLRYAATRTKQCHVFGPTKDIELPK